MPDYEAPLDPPRRARESAPMATDYDVQQATLAIRARVPLEVLRDTIQPIPTFSEAFLYALEDLGKPATMAEAA
jgi:hypothetical protein